MKNGITLIALVVTIVVLLILAGVTINAILGDNGIIAQARRAADAAKEAAENDERNINELANELNSILNGSGTGGTGSGTGDPPTEEENKETITASETKEKHIDIGEKFTIEIADVEAETEITFNNTTESIASLEEATKTVTGVAVGDTTITATWNESNTATINVHVYDPNTIGAPKRIDDYGKMVVGYTDTENNVNSKGYRLFYEDKTYAYLISDNIVDLSNTLENLYTTRYTSPGNVTGDSVSEIGRRLNPMLKDAHPNGQSYTFFDPLNKEYRNIKGVAYLTDTDEEKSPWNKYKDNDNRAAYAIGGPTVELFAYSYNTMEKTEGTGKKDNIKPTVEEYGYKENTNRDWLTTGQRKGIYNKYR